MKIIKRSGTEVTFDIAKIMAAVSKANKEVVHSERLSDEQIKERWYVNPIQQMNRF
jgi:ribonucleoside-triphosphate reductase